MLVTGADRVLLGRAPSWPPRRYSALAGFVEPGESLEEAVAREVAEESGVRVGDAALRRLAAVAVPVVADARLRGAVAGGEPRALEDEIQDVRWFSRAEVAAAAAEDVDGWGGEPDPARPARRRCCCRRAWRSRAGCSSAGSSARQPRVTARGRAARRPGPDLAAPGRRDRGDVALVGAAAAAEHA